jgi:hypothetical protein
MTQKDPDMKPFVTHLMKADIQIWNALKSEAAGVTK